MSMEPRDFAEQARGWVVHHFTVSEPSDQVEVLLRRVADRLEELGPVSVLDLTFCLEVESGYPETRITVYFDFGESERPTRTDLEVTDPADNEAPKR